MTDHVVKDVLEAYAPAGGREDLDWTDVLHRAGERERSVHVRPSRRALLVAAALAVLLLFTLATPAFGLRQALLDLVGREDRVGRENVSFQQGAEAPLVTKRRFAERSVGGLPWLNPRVRAGQARRLVIDTGQRERVLMIAPTSLGGFCYRLQGVGGQCQRNSRTAAEMPEATWWYLSRELPGDRILVRGVTGTVLDDRIVRLTLEFNDGHHVGLRFAWVSAPIRAGFFAYDVPRDRQEEPRGPTAVTGYDARGNVVYRREAIEYPQPTPDVSARDRGMRPRHRIRTDPSAFLLPPFKTGSDRGATIKVGQAGVALLDLRRLEPRLRAGLAGREVVFGCFRIVTQFGATYARVSSIHGLIGATAGAQFHGLGALDGCEVGWWDRHGLRPALEFAFTENGRRYLADRPAARDLASFVTYVRQIRRLDGGQFRSALARRYGDRLVLLASAEGRPPGGKIGYFVAADSVTFVRVSEGGRRFFVELEGGRVTRKNLGRMAWIR